METYDVLVIGTGPAGHHAAIQAAKLGRKTAICERREVVGGVCINTGTIPSKTLREAVIHLTGYAHWGLYGSAYRVKQQITIEDLLFRCQRVIQREIEVSHAQLRRNQVDILIGVASFLDPHRLRVQGYAHQTEVRAEKVVIATGTEPMSPEGLEVDGETLVNSDGILTLRDIPQSLAVVGAGVVGTEYASMFAALGTHVELIDRRNRLLPFVDDQIIEALAEHLEDHDCVLHKGETVESMEIVRPRVGRVTLASGKAIGADLILFAGGRRGSTDELNLPAAGLTVGEGGRLKVDEDYRTDVEHIYAAGDIIGFPALASTAMEQGRLAVAHALGIHATSVPHLFPYGIYSIPEISMVGKTERELKEEGIDYEVGLSRYKEIARGQILGDSTGLLKLLFATKSRKLLGVHIIGTGATELVHIGQAVMALDGNLDYFINHVFNYPTFAECYKVAALDALNRMGYVR